MKYSGRLTIVDSRLADAIDGPSFRGRRLGPEWDLLGRFLRGFHLATLPGYDTLVFREPRLPSGFPDLVIVAWDRKVTGRWKPDRAELTREDLRLAHYLYCVGPCTSKRLERVFARRALGSIERLRAAEIVRPNGGEWRLRPLSRVFAAREIIAVEAKINEWGVGLRQARLNTWFASASYLLVPEVPKRSRLRERARELGVGVWTEESAPFEPARARQLPRSYASWLFNEWAWRAASRV